MKPIRVLFAGGGTGGHLTPGLAVAEELQRRMPDSEIMFIGTDKRIERLMVESSGFRRVGLGGRTPGEGKWTLPAQAFWLLQSMWKSRRVVKKFKPDVVVGLGGYGCAGPATLAAVRGLPLMLLEQNVIPGRATKLFARWSDEVCCQFHESVPRLKQNKVALTGNPVRERIGSCKRDIAAKQLGLEEGLRTLLVLGGSQGALPLNEVMIAIAPLLAERRKSFQIIHIAGKHKIDRVRAAYAGNKIVARVDEFLENMDAAYALADLALCRAGGTSLAELATTGVPSILVPYPHGADDHQTYNAAAFVEKGASILIRQSELEPEKLNELISGLLWDDIRLKMMKQSSLSLATPHAARIVVDHLLEIAKRQPDTSMSRAAAL